MNNHQHINQTSGNTEWYSPPELVEAARRTMGDINLDPATSPKANRLIVKADHIHTAPLFDVVGEINGRPVRRFIGGGLKTPGWVGRIYMNHPFGNSERACSPNCTKKTCIKRGWHTAEDIPGNSEWIERIVREYETGHVQQACVLTFAATSEAWFKPLKAFPQCYIDGRTNYIDPFTMQPIKGVPKGSVVTYLGQDVARFAAEFSPFGEVKVSWQETAGCQWHREVGRYDHEEYWEGDCLVAWHLDIGTPVEHRMNYCPRCGRPLVVAEKELVAYED